MMEEMVDQGVLEGEIYLASGKMPILFNGSMLSAHCCISPLRHHDNAIKTAAFLFLLDAKKVAWLTSLRNVVYILSHM